MHEAFRQKEYFVKEQVGMFKAANAYDVMDPQTKQIVLECREENLSFWTKLFRFTDYKRMTPFDLRVKSKDGKTLVRVKRGVSILLSKVEVLDEMGNRLGGFKQQFFRLGNQFKVLDRNDQVAFTLKGKWTGWDFSFLDANNRELAKVTKKWSGLGKELFTSADNYMLVLNDAVKPDDPVRALIFAAVFCIDLVLKE